MFARYWEMLYVAESMMLSIDHKGIPCLWIFGSSYYRLGGLEFFRMSCLETFSGRVLTILRDLLGTLIENYENYQNSF